MNDDMRILMLNSLERALTPEEQQRLDSALNSSEELREEYREIQALRATLATSARESFGPFFAARVVNRIEAELRPDRQLEAMFQTMVMLFRRVAVISAVAVLALVTYNLSSSDEISVASALGVQNETIEDVLQYPIVASLE